MTSSHYQVLIPVSRGYPCVRGRLPTLYSPVRRYPLLQSTEVSIQRFPLDLHVLGTPPAFILSQDQTLNKWYVKHFCLSSSLSFLTHFERLAFFFRFAKLLFWNCTRITFYQIADCIFFVHFIDLGDQLNDLFDSISTLCCFQGSRSVWRGTFKIIRIETLDVNDFFEVFSTFFKL